MEAELRLTVRLDNALAWLGTRFAISTADGVRRVRVPYHICNVMIAHAPYIN